MLKKITILEKFNVKNLKDKKKVVIISFAAMIIIILVILFIIFSNFSDNKKDKELIKSFEQIGFDFYEEFYYKQIGSNTEEISNFLKKYETVGIKISLDNLSRYKVEENKEIINKLIEKCNKNNTKIIIYPESPYEQKSYRVETKLECDFEKK